MVTIINQGKRRGVADVKNFPPPPAAQPPRPYWTSASGQVIYDKDDDDNLNLASSVTPATDKKAVPGDDKKEQESEQHQVAFLQERLDRAQAEAKHNQQLLERRCEVLTNKNQQLLKQNADLARKVNEAAAQRSPTRASHDRRGMRRDDGSLSAAEVAALKAKYEEQLIQLQGQADTNQKAMYLVRKDLESEMEKMKKEHELEKTRWMHQLALKNKSLVQAETHFKQQLEKRDNRRRAKEYKRRKRALEADGGPPSRESTPPRRRVRSSSSTDSEYVLEEEAEEEEEGEDVKLPPSTQRSQEVKLLEASNALFYDDKVSTRRPRPLSGSSLKSRKVNFSPSNDIGALAAASTGTGTAVATPEDKMPPSILKKSTSSHKRLPDRRPSLSRQLDSLAFIESPEKKPHSGGRSKRLRLVFESSPPNSPSQQD